MKALIIPLLFITSVCFSQADSIVVKVPVGSASGMSAVLNYLLKADSNTYTSRGYYRLKLDSIITALSAKGTSNFDGAYSSLTGKPTLFDGIYSSLTSKPDLTLYKLKSDSGFVGSQYTTGADIRRRIDSITAAMAATYSVLAHTHSYASLTSNPATTVGTNLFTLSNPSAIRYIRINADNTVTALTAAQLLTDVAGAIGNNTYRILTKSPGGTSIVENAALTGSKVVASDGNGQLVSATVSLTEANYSVGVTSAIQTQLDAKAPLASPTFTGTPIFPSSVITNANLAGSIAEGKFGFTDITTANASTSAHGLMPKADNNSLHFYRSDGTQATPSGVNSTITFLSGDVTNSNASANTIADVTALSFAVTSGVTYRFKFFIVYTSAATTTGSRWAINGPSTTFLNYTSRYTVTATSETVNYVAAYDSPAASNASSLSTGNIAIIEGIIKPSASGTVIARFASEVSSSAIVAKANQSYVEFQAIN